MKPSESFVSAVTEHLDTLEGDKDKGKKKPPPPENKTIPKPDYGDPESREKYAEEFTKKYGPLMQGRGDTPLRVNETPFGASSSSKDLATNTAKKLSLDPALLYASAMEEGMSGLYTNKKGDVDYSGDEKYPIQGSFNFGMDTFVSSFQGLVKKGYLPKNFDFKRAPSPDPTETQDSANYKSTEDALQAKAAMVKQSYDQVKDYANYKKIDLSDKAKDFFALVSYNAGYSNAKKMLDDYDKAGALKDDSFLNKRPTKGGSLKESSWKQPYENVIRRIKMADALKSEGLF